MRLLVAEDDPRLLKTLTHIFESNKFSVDGVSNGEDALAHGQTVEYDGMVLDIMMPGMDGISVLKALREAGVTTPALFLAARSEVSQRVEGAGRRSGRLSAQILFHRGTAGPGAGHAAPEGQLPARPADPGACDSEPLHLSAELQRR